MIIHNSPSSLAGKTVRIKCGPDPDELNGKEYRVEDWWDRIAGYSWKTAQGNPACVKYAVRQAFTRPPRPPFDDEALYGKVGPFGHLIHISEIDEIRKEIP